MDGSDHKAAIEWSPSLDTAGIILENVGAWVVIFLVLATNVCYALTHCQPRYSFEGWSSH